MTKLEYFKKWLHDQNPSALEEWEECYEEGYCVSGGVESSDPQYYINLAFQWSEAPSGHNFWLERNTSWLEHIEELDWEQVLEEDPTLPYHLDPKDVPRLPESTLRVGSKAELNNILGFYAAVTGKMTMETQKEKDLFMAILDLSNEY